LDVIGFSNKLNTLSLASLIHVNTINCGLFIKVNQTGFIEVRRLFADTASDNAQ
jgi:hypothetical protein